MVLVKGEMILEKLIFLSFLPGALSIETKEIELFSLSGGSALNLSLTNNFGISFGLDICFFYSLKLP